MTASILYPSITIRLRQAPGNFRHLVRSRRRRFEFFRNFERPFTPRTLKAPIGAKLCQHAFQTIPNISFFGGRKVKILRFFRNFRTAVYPPRIAPIGLKLGQNAFQTIPNISFFDPETKKIFGIFARSDDDVIWSYHDIIRLSSYDHITISYYDHIIISYYDHVIIWPHDQIIILWSCDHMITWSYHHIRIIWSYHHIIISSSYDHMIIWSHDHMHIATNSHQKSLVATNST